MAEEEEILGQDADNGRDSSKGVLGGLGGLFDFSGNLMDSFLPKLLIAAIGIVAIILIVIFITDWTLGNIMLGTDPAMDLQEDEARVDDRASGPLRTLALEQFIITREDPRTGRRRTYQIEMHLAFNPEADRELRPELENRMPQIRDRIYTILGRKEVDELEYRNHQALKDDLEVELNRLLQTSYRIQDIYFTDYVIQ